MRLPIEASLCGLPRRKRKLLLNDSRPSSKERMSSSALLLERASHPRLASDSDGYLIEVGRYTQKALDRFKNDAGQPETTSSSISLLTKAQGPVSVGSLPMVAGRRRGDVLSAPIGVRRLLEEKKTSPAFGHDTDPDAPVCAENAPGVLQLCS